jgi:hypothetical protein
MSRPLVQPRDAPTEVVVESADAVTGLDVERCDNDFSTWRVHIDLERLPEGYQVLWEGAEENAYTDHCFRVSEGLLLRRRDGGGITS